MPISISIIFQRPFLKLLFEKFAFLLRFYVLLQMWHHLYEQLNTFLKQQKTIKRTVDSLLHFETRMNT